MDVIGLTGYTWLRQRGVVSMVTDNSTHSPRFLVRGYLPVQRQPEISTLILFCLRKTKVGEIASQRLLGCAETNRYPHRILWLTKVI